MWARDDNNGNGGGWISGIKVFGIVRESAVVTWRPNTGPGPPSDQAQYRYDQPR